MNPYSVAPFGTSTPQAVFVQFRELPLANQVSLIASRLVPSSPRQNPLVVPSRGRIKPTFCLAKIT